MRSVTKYGSFIFILWLLIGCTDKTLFRHLSSAASGITFNNRITENDSINPIDVTNIYNGGGVGIGDFNNDGLQDIYFTGNLVANALYINKGGLQFNDVTKAAGVGGEGRWCRGVAVVDINCDGRQDIYVCATMLADSTKRENLLYVNQRTDNNGVPVFREMAASYGLNDNSHTTMAAFFDYDNDGDLDVYLVVNQIANKENPSIFHPVITDGSYPSTGRLYNNQWDSASGHPMFKNVTRQAGLTIEGYGHGVSICDLNKDGWKDIFVTNDFIGNDLLYINNKNGSFTNKASAYFKHTSANGMGQDVVDINNDGLSDVIELDMNPEDNYRKKMMMGPNTYQSYQNSDYYKYQYQYVRNTLQLNGGPAIGPGDSIGDPVFSDVGYFAGIAESDWSWTPMVTDFDNDGFRDVVITNGFPRDVTDHDFIAFRKQSYAIASKEFTLAQIPQVKLHNYAFRNNGDVTFTNTTSGWGLTEPSFSNGAAYADLDNDGDMDIVINNINDEASLYENTAHQKGQSHFLSIKLKGDKKNPDGLGTWIEIYYGNKKQAYEQSPYRGYLSTIQLAPHFGLDTVSRLDSVIIKWPNGALQILKDVAADKTLDVSITNATKVYSWDRGDIATSTFFTDVTGQKNISYVHKQTDFIDFNIQKLLPHKFSEYGPALAVGDADGNGTDDLFIGGNAIQPAGLLLQQQDGKFLETTLPRTEAVVGQAQDMGMALFDVDGDGDLDLYIARGGYEMPPNDSNYQDVLLINNGKGVFKQNMAALPKNYSSKSCVRVADYDKDGDLDIFVAGRVDPGNYPKPVSGALYRNDTKSGLVKFTDVTATNAATLQKIGLVCDAVWSDFDGDGWQDLVLTGEWMPVKFLKNDKGVLKDVTASTGTANNLGWWTSLLPGDFDNDGDIDYIAGNLGLNSFFKASDQYPVRMYAKDFDGNGSYDAIPTLYLPASQSDTVKKEFVAHTRDDMTKQLISFKAKFQTYKAYAEATFQQMFTTNQLKGAQVLQANYFSNSFIKNKGQGKFEMVPLPAAAQMACINGMLAEDVDEDGNLDIILCGNDYSTEVSIGRYDACNGLVLKGNGHGSFAPLTIMQSGWYLPGNAKALVKLKSVNGATLISASQNKGPVKMVALKNNSKPYQLLGNDISVLLQYKDGRRQKTEVNYGASFLSQSTRCISINKGISFMVVTNMQGQTRRIDF